jgi:hypothetical protein
MTNVFERFGDFVTGKQKRLELVETIVNKIDSFLAKFFPKKAETTIHVDRIAEITSEFEDIKKLVLNINYTDYKERDHIENILTNLSAYYFEHIPKLKKDMRVSEKDVSEIINGLIIIKHIAVKELERKHKDISTAGESIKLQAIHILETYFHQSSGNQVLSLRMIDLNKDFEILQRKVAYLKEITKKNEQEYKDKITRMDNIIKALHELISYAERKETHYELFDKKQITDKLDFLIDISNL